jgi:DNA-binding SARP family transcriptional activator
MLRLYTLGQLDLRDASDASVRAVLVQPKRLALLTFLASARPNGFHRRDFLLPLFWPELNAARARNALRQAIHQLRAVLGADVVLSRGGEAVGIDPSRLWCDATEFDDVLDRGGIVDALALYGGDFLPGFFIDGSPTFDRWLDEMRSHLRGRAARALWALAEQQERLGNRADAAEIARRAASLTAYDEGALRQLIGLLDRVGDSTGAVRAFDDFAERLRRELELEPSAETKALLDTIRSRANARVHASSDALLADQSSSAHRRKVAVTPFENLTGDAAFDFVGRLVSESIAQGIVETRLVDVVGAERAAGDALVVSGSYVLIDELWHFRPSVQANGGSRLGSIAEVTARRERPWEAADELCRRVSGVLAGHLDHRTASLARSAGEPPDLESYQEQVLGIELHLRGDFHVALPHFLRAARGGNGFTLPLLWAIQASLNLEEYEQADAILAELSAHRSRLSAFEQYACDYFTATLVGNRADALRAAQLGASLVPNSEIASLLGREALFSNHPKLAAEVMERIDPERGWIPSWTPYWRRSTEAYHVLGDHQRELSTAVKGRRQHPEAISTLLYVARARAALGDVAEVERAADEAAAMTTDRFMTAGELLFTSAQELRAHGRAADSMRFFERAVDWYADRLTDGADHRTRYAFARALYESERWPEAKKIFAELLSARPDDLDAQGSLGCLAARVEDATTVESILECLRARRGRFHFGKHLIWTARIQSLRGDLDAAMTSLRGALARGYCYGIDLHLDIDLSPLWADQRFRELLRPKG